MSDLVLEELFDIDNYFKLCRHNGVSKDEKNKLHKYKRLSRDGNKVLIEYDYGKNWNSLKFGDFYPIKGIGLSCFGREIRACLAQKHYWDLDLVNAHPSIIQNFCKTKGWLCPVLDRFIINRDEIIKTICSEHRQERWWAKEECIKVFNGGASCVHPILLELVSEIERIRDNIIPLYPKVYKKALSIKKNENDAKITTLSLVFQEQTKTILNCVSYYLKTKGRSLDVRIHDGGLVRKLENETEFPNELIRGAECFILEKLNYDVKLEIKPLNYTYQFNETDYFINNDTIVNDAYACEKFIELVDLVKVGSELYVFNSKTGKYDREVKQQIINNKNQLIFKQKTDTNKIKVFDYGGCTKNINNMLSLLPQFVEEKELPFIFKYTLCTEEHPEHNSEILEAFFSLIDLATKKNELRKKYRLSYLAHLIQKPRDLPGVCLIDSGKEGVGKDTTSNFIIDFVIGKDYCAVYGNNSSQIFDKHDSGRMNKLIVKIEEPKKSIFIENQDALKSFITTERSSFNLKNVRDSIEVNNYNRFWCSTNYGCPFNITENDRRFEISDFSSERKGDMVYWKWIRDVLYNDYAGKVIGKFLESYDISSYDPRVLSPSEYKEIIQEENTPIEKKFIDSKPEEWDDWMKMGDIYIIYSNWCKINGCDTYKADSVKSLGKRFIIYLRDGLLERRVLDGYNLYRIV